MIGVVLRSFRRNAQEVETDLMRQVLDAHARTIAICEACASTTRDLAAEVKRGGTPNPADLQSTVEEAERVLADLEAVRAEVERLRTQLGVSS